MSLWYCNNSPTRRKQGEIKNRDSKEDEKRYTKKINFEDNSKCRDAFWEYIYIYIYIKIIMHGNSCLTGLSSSHVPAGQIFQIKFLIQSHKFIRKYFSPNSPKHIQQTPPYEIEIWLSVVIGYDSKVHGANMGPIWGRQDPGGPHVGPMNFAIREAMNPMSFLWSQFTIAAKPEGV